MKLTCMHQEDFEWAAANRQMTLFRSKPSFHLIHALSPSANPVVKLVCGVYNTEEKRGVMFDNPLDYANWTYKPDAAFCAFKVDGTDRIFLLNVEEGHDQPTNTPA